MPRNAPGYAGATIRESGLPHSGPAVVRWSVKGPIAASAHRAPTRPGSIRYGVSMDLPETTTHSFIVKIWLEETAEETGQARWRGHITHVPSGERRHLKDLGDITAFIVPYLERMGVKLTLILGRRRWFKWQK
jgi:hypothetical protein